MKYIHFPVLQPPRLPPPPPQQQPLQQQLPPLLRPQHHHVGACLGLAFWLPRARRQVRLQRPQQLRVVADCLGLVFWDNRILT